MSATTARDRLHFSSQTDDWETPPELFAKLDAEFGFTLDVAASGANYKCARYFTVDDDALSLEWKGVVWCNPPYGRTIGKWIRKACLSALDGATVVCLVPARTDTAWWHDWAERANERRFLRGRVRFHRNGVAIGDRSKGGANSPFPSAILVFRAVERAVRGGAR